MLTLPPDVDAQQIIARIDAAIRELEALRQQLTSTTNTSALSSVAIGGWLQNYQFTVDDIEQVRAEMWPRFSST